MPQYDSSFIDMLTSRADIVDLASRHTRLTRKGGRYWGCCPFHNEKTPSFTVSPDKQLYYCFGCGRGGSVIGFVMESERLDFAEAVEFLAKLYNVELPAAGNEKAVRIRQRILDMNAEAARFFYRMLASPQGGRARAYIQKRRLSAATVKAFAIGYAPGGWDALTNHLRSKGYTNAEMVEGDLARKGKSGGVYGVFRDRLMFPIIDAKNNVVAFGGRVLEGDGGGQKYLNTGNTPVFQKKYNLYGYHIARKSRAGQVILVEGYMDTVMLHQAGFSGTVASLGTALTPEQARMISKIAPEVVIAYDADRAGAAATSRAIEIFRECGVNARILRVPGAKDPDDYIKEFGAEGFERLLNRSEEHIDYRLNSVKAGKNLTDAEQRVAYITAAVDVLSDISSRIELEVYAGRVAEETGVSRDAILSEVELVRKKKASAARKKQRRVDTSPDRLIQPVQGSAPRYKDPPAAKREEMLISLLSDFPELLPGAASLTEEHFSSKELFNIFSAFRLSGADAAALQQALSPEEMRLYSKIVSSGYPHQDPERELEDLLTAIKKEADNGTDPLLRLRDYKRKSGFGGY